MKYLFLISILIAYHAAIAKADEFFIPYNPNGLAPQKQVVDPSQQSYQQYMQRIQQQQNQHCTSQWNGLQWVTNCQ